MAGKRWTQEEFEVVVKKYCKLWKMQNICDSELIKESIDECVSELNGSRSSKSVRMRFQNISHVFSVKKRPIINGCAPLVNISNKHLELMWRIASKEIGERSGK
jgi:hypothetical protein